MVGLWGGEGWAVVLVVWWHYGVVTITVDIRPEVQAELARQAAAQGRAVEAYAASLLEEAVQVPGGARRLDQERLENTLREMAQFSQKIPSLPDEAFTSDSLYRYHD